MKVSLKWLGVVLAIGLISLAASVKTYLASVNRKEVEIAIVGTVATNPYTLSGITNEGKLKFYVVDNYDLTFKLTYAGKVYNYSAAKGSSAITEFSVKPNETVKVAVGGGYFTPYGWKQPDSSTRNCKPNTDPIVAAAKAAGEEVVSIQCWQDEGTDVDPYDDFEVVVTQIGAAAASPSPITITSTCVNFSETAMEADTNTIGLWHFNEASGDVLDSSGKNNTGIPIGTTVVPGIIESGRNIDGVVGSGINISEISGNTNFTFEAWAKLNPAASGWNTIIITRDGGLSYNSTTNIFSLVIFADRNGGYNRTPAIQYLYAAAVTIPRNEWIYYTFVVDNSNNGKFYANGVEILIGNRVTDGGVTGDYQTAIGALKLSTNVLERPWKGVMDEARISNKARSAAEITATFNTICLQIGISPSPEVSASPSPNTSVSPSPNVSVSPSPSTSLGVSDPGSEQPDTGSPTWLTAGAWLTGLGLLTIKLLLKI